MVFSLSITNYSWPSGPAGLGSELARILTLADDAGLDTVWVADHLIQADPTSTPDSEMLEAYATLGFLAAQTHRVRLGTMVTGVTFRPRACSSRRSRRSTCCRAAAPGSASAPATW